ncbi:MAG: LicD family protein [Phascolarctobacterium sp.]|uniref:LicD family protein n=1 Tax=Phascolarctobacterium sp. TaxID=2049039 RepID=UPI0026DD3199|nr:LicD family protein [Phascolarctobacterium sp.]MDO4921925.1 LicD family protein [Phascolarctobacterium sp.]
MRKLDIENIKKIELQILFNFDAFCKAKNLKYYLAGGTLLGSIRHKGFIPWDDDIDVCMPRKDYLKFVKSFDGYDAHLKVHSNLKGNFGAPFAKIVDTRTRIDSKYVQNDIDTHLWIDVFPVDGLPENIADVEKIYQRCNFYRRLLLLTDAKLGEGTTAFHKYSKYLLKPLARIYGKQRCIDNIEKIAEQYPYESAEYAGIITWGLYGAGERMLKSEFEQAVEVEFEGHKFPAFSCWDSYLKGLYGNYMQLPPVEKRRTHDMTAYLIEK